MRFAICNRCGAAWAYNLSDTGACIYCLGLVPRPKWKQPAVPEVPCCTVSNCVGVQRAKQGEGCPACPSRPKEERDELDVQFRSMD